MSKPFKSVVLYLKILPKEIIQGKWVEGRNLMHREAPNNEKVSEN